jgi:hypothetical protein
VDTASDFDILFFCKLCNASVRFAAAAQLFFSYKFGFPFPMWSENERWGKKKNNKKKKNETFSQKAVLRI